MKPLFKRGDTVVQDWVSTEWHRESAGTCWGSWGSKEVWVSARTLVLTTRQMISKVKTTRTRWHWWKITKEDQEVADVTRKLTGNSAARIESLMSDCVERGNNDNTTMLKGQKPRYRTIRIMRTDWTHRSQYKRTPIQQQYERQLSSETMYITLWHKKMLLIQCGKSNHTKNVMIQHDKTNHTENLGQSTKIVCDNSP